jgi:hypothetical protein
MTTQSGVNAEQNAALSFTEDDAAEQFLSRWSDKDPEEVSESPEEEDVAQEDDEPTEHEAEEEHEEAEGTDEDPQEDESEETDEQDEGDDDEKEPVKKGKTLDDEAKVKIKVDDEELEVSVKDLKRLYGQEAALTKKSQQVASQRKEVEAANQKAAAQIDRIYQKAAARWEPYSKIDMLVASKQLDAESFTALRAEAQAAWDDFRFITQEVDTFVANANEQRQQAMKAAAVDAVKTLQEKLPGWNQKVYDEVRSYGIDKGLAPEVINNMVDANALLIIHKAMQFDKAKSVVTKKVNNTPKKVLKTTKAVTSNDAKVDKTTKAKQRLKTSGSTDDAADLFLARWAAE